ncbi:MAG TPA: hypothetical protein VKU40_13695, partial [Thermoanaerobaculia bacterium]|nr:hypothetical protein [Thermoanaerobaculia bacterium]
VVTTGCVSFAENVATRLAAKRGGEIERVVSVLHSDAEAYRDCLETRGGACPERVTASATAASADDEAATPAPPRPLTTTVPASARASISSRYAEGSEAGEGAAAAMAVLDHPVQQRINGLFNQLRGCPQDNEPQVEVSVPQMSDYADKLSTAASLGGFDRLAESAAAAPAKATASQEDRQQHAAHSRTAAYLAAYLRAYFENGRFVQLELDVDDLESRLRSSLAERYPSICGAASAASEQPAGERQASGDFDPGEVVTCDDLVADLRTELFRGVTTGADGNYLFAKMSTDGYVSRDGESFRFPGVTVTFDPGGEHPVEVSKVDFTRVGSDLVRVALEAIFDAHEGLPAVSDATGVTLDGAADGVAGLPVFAPTGTVSAADFGAVNTLSTRTEATVGAVVGRAIRGGGPIALNNDALADLLTTAVAVTVAKAGEKASWCFYSCGLDEQVEEERKRLGAAVRKATLRLVP